MPPYKARCAYDTTLHVRFLLGFELRVEAERLLLNGMVAGWLDK
jgi:hypothetical protein